MSMIANPDNAARRVVLFRLDPRMHKALRRFAVEEDSTSQRILVEAVTRHLQAVGAYPSPGEAGGEKHGA